ncbi:hypothetical protein N9Z67_02735, partial [Rhodopirellula sp.]|nr:hypothetical protein [Rhodopirellula sp.]
LSKANKIVSLRDVQYGGTSLAFSQVSSRSHFLVCWKPFVSLQLDPNLVSRLGTLDPSTGCLQRVVVAFCRLTRRKKITHSGIVLDHAPDRTLPPRMPLLTSYCQEYEPHLALFGAI